MNFQMFKMDLEKADEPEIKLPTLLNHRKSKRVPEKHLFLLFDYAKPLTVWITTNWKILQARLQTYMICERPDVQARFRKGRRTRDQIVNICWIIEKARYSRGGGGWESTSASLTI